MSYEQAVKPYEMVKPVSKAYAAQKLLEHGPLTLGQFIWITGWSRGVAWGTLQKLMEQGIVGPVGPKLKTVYTLQSHLDLRG